MATEAKTEGFTPGPWGVGEAVGGKVYNPSNVATATGRSIAQVYGISLHTTLDLLVDRDSEGLANAHLIAAAPDLYAAVRDVEWVQTYGESTSIVVERCPWCGLSKKSGHAKNCELSAALRKAGGAA